MRKHGNHDFAYFFQEGFSNMFTHGFMSFAAIGITVACLLIMGTFSLVAVNAEATLSDLEEENQVLAFVDESLTEEQARALEDDLLAVPNVASVEFISRTEAMETFQADYEDEALFQGLPDSTLRHRFAVTPEDISKQAELREDLLAVDGIAKVNAWDELSDGFITIRNIAAVVCVALIAILFLDRHHEDGGRHQRLHPLALCLRGIPDGPSLCADRLPAPVGALWIDHQRDRRV